MEKDGALLGLFMADAAEAIARRRDDINLATARQRDGAAYDMRALGGFIVAQLFTSDNAENFANLNTASRMPSTLDHPNAVVGKGAAA